MALFNRLFGSAAKFEKSVAAYPILVLPYKGEGRNLDASERNANLEHIVAIKDERCWLLRGFLNNLGIDLPPASSVTPESDISRLLHEFNRGTLAHVAKIELICAPGWRERVVDERSSRILSVAMDVGIYCGECSTNPVPGFKWEIDSTRYRKQNAMPSEGNVCIYKAKTSDTGTSDVYIDILDWAVYSIYEAARGESGKAMEWVNTFSFFDDIMTGRHG